MPSTFDALPWTEIAYPVSIDSVLGLIALAILMTPAPGVIEFHDLHGVNKTMFQARWNILQPATLANPIATATSAVTAIIDRRLTHYRFR